MRYPLLIVIFAVLFLGCSQDEKSDSKSKQVVKVEKKVEKSADKNELLICLDENEKITCKLMTKRVNSDRKVVFEWKSPNGKDDRERDMVLPANHASIFDLRHKAGREKGKWKVTAELDDEEVSTTFRIQ
ncbi:MAG: hypothetical protein PF439_02625 [Helicobacteraceae bacterium]|jgi:hypothetical protein|nr:hypothetical protein [Helicobacteraceae bacterium]